MSFDEKGGMLPRRKSNGVSAQNSQPEEVDTSNVFDGVPFKMMFTFLGFVGTMPFTWKKPYSPSLHPTKSTVLPSIALYMVLFVFIYRSISTFAYRLRSEGENLPTYVFIMFFLYGVLCLYVVTTAAVMADVPLAQKAIRHWMQLSILYREITNRNPPTRWRYLEKSVLVVVVLVAPCLFVMLKKVSPELGMEYEHSVPILHSCATFFSICSLWIAYYSYLEVWAKDINTELTQNIQQNLLTSEKLRIYRDAWIEMRKLNDTLSSSYGPFIALVVSLLYLILCSFKFILLIQAEMYSSSFPVLFFTVFNLALLTNMARACDLASAQVKNLYSVILAQLNVVSIRAIPQYQVLNMFLIENVRDVTPTFGGFVVVSKALILSVFAAITMNIVILAQITHPGNS